MKLPFLTALLIFYINSAFCQVSLKDIALENGNYNVGFRHYLVADSTRTYKRIFDWNNQSIPRPVPVSIWYPSSASPRDKRIMILDYMKILAEEEEWEHLPDEQILNWFYYPNTPANREHLKELSTAFFNTPPIAGKFPVVVYAPSYQASSIENFALCEYLASHGYMVIASPSRGTENRFLEGGTAKDMETQARDIDFLVQEVSRYPNADGSRLATMGFSFGGLSNVLSQMRNANFKAIVSLDGTIKYHYETLNKSPFANIEKVNIPFIHMAQKDIPEQVLTEDKIDPALNYRFDFYDSLVYSKAYSFKFHNLTHAYFSTLGVLFKERDKRQDKPDKEIMTSYKWAAVYALNFLDAYLKHRDSGETFLANTPEANGVAKGLISKRTKDPLAMPFTFQDFNEIASAQEYNRLRELFDSIRLKYPAFKPTEGQLNNLGLQLTFNDSTSTKGIHVLVLATTIYPQSANLFDSLGEACLYAGDKEGAIKNFERSLQLNNQNQNAIDRLKELKTKATP